MASSSMHLILLISLCCVSPIVSKSVVQSNEQSVNPLVDLQLRYFSKFAEFTNKKQSKEKFLPRSSGPLNEESKIQCKFQPNVNKKRTDKESDKLTIKSQKQCSSTSLWFERLFQSGNNKQWTNAVKRELTDGQYLDINERDRFFFDIQNFGSARVNADTSGHNLYATLQRLGARDCRLLSERVHVRVAPPPTGVSHLSSSSSTWPPAKKSLLTSIFSSTPFAVGAQQPKAPQSSLASNVSYYAIYEGGAGHDSSQFVNTLRAHLIGRIDRLMADYYNQSWPFSSSSQFELSNSNSSPNLNLNPNYNYNSNSNANNNRLLMAMQISKAVSDIIREWRHALLNAKTTPDDHHESLDESFSAAHKMQQMAPRVNKDPNSRNHLRRHRSMEAARILGAGSLIVYDTNRFGTDDFDPTLLLVRVAKTESHALIVYDETSEQSPIDGQEKSTLMTGENDKNQCQVRQRIFMLGRRHHERQHRYIEHVPLLQLTVEGVPLRIDHYKFKANHTRARLLLMASAGVWQVSATRQRQYTPIRLVERLVADLRESQLSSCTSKDLELERNSNSNSNNDCQSFERALRRMDQRARDAGATRDTSIVLANLGAQIGHSSIDVCSINSRIQNHHANDGPIEAINGPTNEGSIGANKPRFYLSRQS